MKLAKARDLKFEILSSLKNGASKITLGAALQNVVTESRSKRIAVGFSKGSEGYQLELRAQGKGAMKLAQEIKALVEKEDEGSVNVGRVKAARIPSWEDMKDQNFDPFCQSVRPLCLGLSIGRIENGSGTLGAFLEHDDGYYVILSCNHVLALFRPARSEDELPIYQPGPADKQTLLADDIVATLTNAAALKPTGSNITDSAIAKIRQGVLFTGNIVPEGRNSPFEGLEIEPLLAIPSPILKYRNSRSSLKRLTRSKIII